MLTLDFDTSSDDSSGSTTGGASCDDGFELDGVWTGETGEEGRSERRALASFAMATSWMGIEASWKYFPLQQTPDVSNSGQLKQAI